MAFAAAALIAAVRYAGEVTWPLSASARYCQAAIAASVDTPGLVRISAGNYGGRLGKSFIYLYPEKQPAGE